MVKINLKRMLIPFLFLSSLPYVFAARSGIQGLDSVIELLGRIFYPSVLLRNQRVQVGFFKFLYFIIIFAVVNWVLNKYVFGKGDDPNGKRVSGTVAFAFAGIAAWFMPVKVALGTAGMMTAIMNLILPLSITVGAVYFCFKKLNKEWWEHLLSIVILFMVVFILQWMLAFIA